MHLVFLSTVTAFSYAPRYRKPLQPLPSRNATRCSWLVRFSVILSLWLVGSASAAQLTVSWDDNSSSEVGFKVERSTNGSTFTTIGIVGSNQTSYVDSSV